MTDWAFFWIFLAVTAVAYQVNDAFKHWATQKRLAGKMSSE
jgi:hypothetical protein